MNWKTKAFIQKFIASLPVSIGDQLYFQIQRRFGNLKSVKPLATAIAGLETCQKLISLGHKIRGTTFLEVGTGRMITIPIIYWLAGAKKTVTVDLHHYLRQELVKDSITQLAALKDQLFSNYASIIDPERWEHLCAIGCEANSLSQIQELTGIEYVAPADATKLTLDSKSVDFHTSYTVLEHIPEQTLESILKEAKRILKPTGKLIHHVDYSDHFSHSDKSINALNFLRYSDREWQCLAGNRFMYMNRLRHNDYIRLLEKSGFNFIDGDSNVLPDLLTYVGQNRKSFDSCFNSYSDQELAATSGWLIAAI